MEEEEEEEENEEEEEKEGTGEMQMYRAQWVREGGGIGARGRRGGEGCLNFRYFNRRPRLTRATSPFSSVASESARLSNFGYAIIRLAASACAIAVAFPVPRCIYDSSFFPLVSLTPLSLSR